MEQRWFALSMGALLLAACSGAPKVSETVYRRRPTATSSARTSAPKSARSSTRTATLASNVTQSSKTAAAKDAEERQASAGSEEMTDDIAKDAEETFGPLVRRRGVVKAVTAEEEDKISATGIEGSMSEYDVKETLEGHAAEFDRCHDEVGSGSGHVTFRIRILPSGDVGEVGVRKSSVRNQKLVGCYSDVITASHFNSPHGGYANVTWSTKVGRSKKRPDAMFERKVRWDAPSSASESSSPERSEKRRHRSRRRHDS